MRYENSGMEVKPMYLTVREAAQRLGVSQSVVRKMIDRGVLRVFRPYDRARFRIPVEEVERVLQPRPVRSTEGQEQT
jgi:excisionase family DNA binding protein